MVDFPYSKESEDIQWSNYHGTIADFDVPLVVVPDVPGEIDMGAPRKLERCGKALSEVVGYAIENKKTLRTVGSRWSLSRIVEPGQIVLDPGYLNTILRVKKSFLCEDYKAKRTPKGYVPIFAQAGTTVRSLNKGLGVLGLALRTSGASDGHRIAGAIATGTHGSAFRFGAVHDSVLAVHLVVAKDKSLLVVPKTKPVVSEDLGEWLEASTKVPTQTVRSDTLFAAAQVALGSLGIVHGVVLEAEPLYKLGQRIIPMAADDPKLWKAIDTLDTSGLHDNPKEPFHFEVVFSPYPPRYGPGAYVSLMWKRKAKPPAVSGPPADPELSSELFDIIGRLSQAIDGPVGGSMVEQLVNRLLGGQYPGGQHRPRFPGEVFGPTSLPPGQGSSTEIAVDQKNAKRMLETVFAAVKAESHAGRHHLGAFGVRFVKGGTSLMGMNQAATTTTIEMGGIRTDESMSIFERCWRDLDDAGVPFACHWGQVGGFDPKRVETYYGAKNVKKWKEARKEILTSKTARRVFATPVLVEAGLD